MEISKPRAAQNFLMVCPRHAAPMPLQTSTSPPRRVPDGRNGLLRSISAAKAWAACPLFQYSCAPRSDGIDRVDVFDDLFGGWRAAQCSEALIFRGAALDHPVDGARL